MANNANKKKKKNYRGRKPSKIDYRGTREEKAYDEGERNAANEEEIRKDKSGKNDPSWYANNDQLLRDAASLAFGTPIGMRLDLDAQNDIEWNSVSEFQFKNYSIPGICALTMAPTIGVSSDNTSAINIAARNLYSYVRHANSGSKNYESPDLMMYCVGMASLYSYYAFCVRAYGILRTYSQINRYLPQGLFQAMGLDFADFNQNIADFRYFINMFAEKLGAFAVPADLSYFLRQVWLYTNVFTDSTSPKCQLYVTKPYGFYRFNETTPGEPGKLEFFRMGSSLTFSSLANVGQMMMERISNSEDFNIMSGDILKAFGSNLFRVGPVPEDYIVTPVYNEMVLAQIHNATVLSNVEIPDITQDVTISANGGALISAPYCSTVLGGNVGSTRLLDLRTVTPEPALVMEATRNMVTTKEVSEGGVAQRYDIASCGADLCVGMNIFYFTSDINNPTSWTVATDVPSLSYITPINVPATIESTESIAAVVRSAARLEQFDWHPFINLEFHNSNQNSYDAWGGSFGDTDNVITVVEKDLRKMHDTAMLSMFSVPSMGALGMK